MKKGRISAVKDSFSMDVGLTKVDSKKRIVSGFATLDNVDLQGDLVEFEASLKAFERSKKNVREMHQPIAVGKVVSYEPKEYMDEDGSIYRGVYVSAYVSTGAESTWQKVLDGTLSGFSIKGPIRDSVMEMREGASAPVRVIKDYDLEELSLVDAGGNQLANVFSIEKSVDGESVTGMATDVEIDNIFWCEINRTASLSKNETETCPDGHDMVQIGWIESGDPDAIQKMKNIVAEHVSTNSQVAEGGVSMAEIVKSNDEVEAPAPDPQFLPDSEAVETVSEEVVSEEVVEAPEAEAVSEAPAPDPEYLPENVEGEAVSEAPDESDELVKVHKMVSDLEKKIDSGLDAHRSALTEAIERIEKSVIDSREENVKKLNDFEQKYEEMKKSIDDISGKFESVSKSVEALDGSAALKKSNDLGGSEGATTVRGSGLWNNAIL